MNNESNERKKGAILSYLSIILSTLIQLLYTPFQIKMLGQSEYGLYSLVSSIIGYLTVLDLGFGNAIVVYTSKYREQGKKQEEEKLHGMFLIIFCIIGIIAVILGLVLYINVDVFFANTMNSIELKKAKIMMLILTFNLAITFPLSIYPSIITAYEKFTFQKILSIINTLAKPLIMIPLLIMGYKSVEMTLVITLINIIILTSNYIYCRKKLNIKIKYKGFDKKLFRLILNYSFFIFLAVIVDKINWSLDQFILGAVSGTVAVSLYSVASQLNSLFCNLSTAISAVLLPKMSKMVAKNATNEELTNEFIKIGRIQYFFIFLIASGLTLFGKEFIIAWAGEEFKQSYYITIILVIPLCIPLIQNLGISIMQAKNMHKFRSMLLSGIAILNIILSIPLAKKYNAIGTAIGTSLSLIIGNIIILNIYYHKKVGIDIKKFWENIIKLSINFLIPVILILIAMNLFSLNGYIHVIVFGSLYTIMYVFVSYFFAMNKYEKDIIKNFIIKIKKVKHGNNSI